MGMQSGLKICKINENLPALSGCGTIKIMRSETFGVRRHVCALKAATRRRTPNYGIAKFWFGLKWSWHLKPTEFPQAAVGMSRIFINDEDRLEYLAAAMGCSPHLKTSRRCHRADIDHGVKTP